MPNPRKPTALKQLQGTTKPCRTNPREPIPVGVWGEPPENLLPDELQAWLEISERIAQQVATSADMHLVEIVARIIAKFRADTITGWGMSSLMKGLSQLGMTPADRSKIVTIEKKKESTWGK